MTLTLLNNDNQQQKIVSVTFRNINKGVGFFSESTNDEQTSAFTCTPGSSHYSFIEALFQNPPKFVIKNQTEGFR